MTEPHRHEAGQGPVVVDIGGDVGALVLLVEPGMAGEEIEIGRADGSGTRSHVAVHERPVGDGAVHAAVYPALPEGDYVLWPPAGGPAVGPVTVAGGRITEVAWSQLLSRG